MESRCHLAKNMGYKRNEMVLGGCRPQDCNTHKMEGKIMGYINNCNGIQLVANGIK